VTFPKYGGAKNGDKCLSQLHPKIQYGSRQNSDQYRSVCILRIQSKHGLYGKQG
jgi:hypothetical protein